MAFNASQGCSAGNLTDRVLLFNRFRPSNLNRHFTYVHGGGGGGGEGEYLLVIAELVL